MSRTKEWLMDQVQADVDELLARVGHLEAGIAQLRAACEAVMDDLNDEQSDAWVRPDVRQTLRAAINQAKGAAE